ncbi:MAG: hypothetical protein AAF627_10645 [Myxococcota bacterium]
MRVAGTSIGLCCLLACSSTPTSDPAAATAAAPGPAFVYDRVTRTDFNRWSAKLDLPFYWAAGDDEVLRPEGLHLLFGVEGPGPEVWVDGARFTSAFQAEYEKVVAAQQGQRQTGTLAPEELRRRAAVEKELDQGHPTLISWDFAASSQADRGLVEHVLAAAEIIEGLYARQKGVDQLQRPADPASRRLMRRNQGPFCVAPGTESDPDCRALPDVDRVFGLYPAKLQQRTDFCGFLSKRKDADALLDPFTVVRVADGRLQAVPYHRAYAAPMKEVAEHLQAAAGLQPPEESALVRYLESAAKAFEDGSWMEADEAWAAMNAENSRWYLRIGPDEVYFEPCNRKAAFHVSFARINEDSLAWQAKLDPVKQEMENALSRLAGRAYRARKVAFHLPDFIDIVLNAGDSRKPHGATIGQSLPNWGPVANEGRGRTVAMTNLYTDPDSQRTLTTQAESLFCDEVMEVFSAEPAPQVMSTVLHEAAHNLGPAHEYEVRGKTDDQIFGGPLASTFEELKAQTSALYLASWLAEKGVIEKAVAQKAHVRDLAWAFGHISRGMYTASDQPKSYSQLAAIQFGFLMDEGAVKWMAERRAANGLDMGCFQVDLAQMEAAAEKLEKRVLIIKGQGRKRGAERLVAQYVDAEARQATMQLIQERWLRAPKATFVYSIRP